ncbi:hypothetical protein FICEBENF_02307 [Aeromonas hydrophila]
MNTFYKYLPDTFSLENHLSNPELKLSKINRLNDPFEGKISNQALSLVSHHMYEKIKVEFEGLDKIEIERIFHESLNLIKDSICIASFSETQRNLLMWSHYAAQHKGICIGYDASMLTKEGKNHSFKKVNYDSILFDQEFLEEASGLINEDFHSADMIIDRLATTKSNDWSYEKEHRYISSCEHADKIKILTPYDSLNPSTKEAIIVAEILKTHEIIKKEDCIECISNRTEEDLVDIENSNFEVDIALASEENTLILKSIEKKNIKKIYFGVFFDKARMQGVLNKIDSDPELKHISVYVNEIPGEGYELKQNKIRPL